MYQAFAYSAATLHNTENLMVKAHLCYKQATKSADQVMLNPLITDNAIRHRLTLATCYQLTEDRFCASKKGGIGGGGWVSAQGAVHMAAALAGC